jgi:hypothetical protein
MNFFNAFRHYIMLILFFFLAFLIACEKDVVLDLADREGTFLIVEADLTDNGGRQWIKLTRSTSYYDQNAGLAVSDAKVIVRSDELEYNFYEGVDSLAGYYFNNIISEQLTGQIMYLEIEHYGKKYTATSRWNPLPGLDSISIRLNIFSQLGFLPDTLYDILVHFTELPEKDNFYLFNLYVNDTLKTGRPRSKGLLSDRNLNDYVSLAVLNVNQKDIKPGDQLTVEMRSISEEYFNFYNIFFFQTDLSGNPFAGAPPANIPTNLSSGARGFFQISAVERKSIEFTPLIR